MSSRKRRLFCWITLTIFSLFLVSTGYAQSSDAEIAGATKDASGTAVPSAKITLTNQDSGVARSVAADPEGRYRFAVPPGKYSLKIEAAGFRSETWS